MAELADALDSGSSPLLRMGVQIPLSALPKNMDISEFQQIIKDTYYDRDSQRGLWPNFGWLMEELGELAQDIRKGTKQDQERELGDVLAWLVSIANILDIDISRSIARYTNSCPKCGHIPCRCH